MKAILTYHSIDRTGSVISVTPETFERHVGWLVDAEIPVVPLEEIVDPSCPDGIALTFDDGFENFAQDAWPILRAHRLPATVFVVADRAGERNRWDADDPRIPDLPLMGWKTLSELARAGVDLGAHTRSHPDLRRLTPEEARSEIEGSRSSIEERTGVEPTAFAYPYGHYTPTVRAAVEQAGFNLAVTTEMGLLDGPNDPPFELPRLDAYYFRRPGTLESWGRPSFRAYVHMRSGIRRTRLLLTRAGILS